MLEARKEGTTTIRMSGSINPFIQLELTNHSHAFTGAITLFLALLVHTILLTLRRRQQTCFPVVPGAIPFLGHALSLSDPEEFVTVLTKWAKEVGKDGVYEFHIQAYKVSKFKFPVEIDLKTRSVRNK